MKVENFHKKRKDRREQKGEEDPRTAAMKQAVNFAAKTIVPKSVVLREVHQVT